MSDRRCQATKDGIVCGHPKTDHYEYILNGEPQGCCLRCDPMKDMRGELCIGIVAGSAFDKQNRFADHDFADPDDLGLRRIAT